MVVKRNLRAFGGALIASAMLLPAVASAGDYSTVTDARLNDPEPENWLMYRGNYEGWGFSPLAEINTGNVKDLAPAWAFSTNVTEGHQSPPMVNDGIMFITTPQNQTIALDAETGEQLWRHQSEISEELFQLHPTNRGAALYGDNVYVTTTDCFVVALNAKTGEEVWKTAVDDWQNGYYLTMAPLIAEGMVMVGTSGGEYGIRGHVTAMNATTGAIEWVTHTIPAPGEPGSETWENDAWKTGGGSVWLTGNYDSETGISYWGTGNAAPWTGDLHPGDNLYTASTIGLRVSDGKLVGHHQSHWTDSWAWDEVSTPLLRPLERGGEQVNGLVHAGRNGYLWLLDRGTGSDIGFVDAHKYVRQDVFTSIDPNTGRPTYNEANKPVVGKEIHFCPSLWGGKDWPPEAYNPNTGMFYIPVNDNLCGSLIGEDVPYEAGELWLGVPIPEIKMYYVEGSDHIGEVQAWNLNSGEEVWATNFESFNWGPLLATGGNLVFSGGTWDRYFRAFHGETGEILWKFKTNSGITAVPSSYSVNGKQYIAVQAGWGVDAVRMEGSLNAERGWEGNVPPSPIGGVLWVFALD
jgi:alcohol dehydrogenase (cytochrome c)